MSDFGNSVCVCACLCVWFRNQGYRAEMTSNGFWNVGVCVCVFSKTGIPFRLRLSSVHLLEACIGVQTYTELEPTVHVTSRKSSNSSLGLSLELKTM